MCWNAAEEIDIKVKRNRTVVRPGQKWKVHGVEYKVLATTQNKATVKYTGYYGDKFTESILKMDLKIGELISEGK